MFHQNSPLPSRAFAENTDDESNYGKQNSDRAMWNIKLKSAERHWNGIETVLSVLQQGWQSSKFLFTAALCKMEKKMFVLIVKFWQSTERNTIAVHITLWIRRIPELKVSMWRKTTLQWQDSFSYQGCKQFLCFDFKSSKTDFDIFYVLGQINENRKTLFFVSSSSHIVRATDKRQRVV